MSYRTLNTKPLNTTVKSLLKRGAHLGLGIGAFTPMLAMANPSGGNVAAGQATIATQGSNGMVITQTSAAAIINWQQFNIGAGQYVQFVQPSSSAIVLNRVIGGGSSSIYGSLSGNGQIFLINTNGVFFGHGASIDAQGFLASTLAISDSDFLARNFVFNKSGSDAQVVNQGNISAHKGGYVVLAGDYAENDGVIAAQSGHVVLASGTKGTLTLNGNSLVSFAVNQATLAQYAGVKNTGSLIADGGTVVMTADVANALKATVVNNTGLVEAHGLTKTPGGIYLTATGGNIENSGTLDANAADAATAGGNVQLKTDGDAILDPTSVIDANGLGGAKGGTVELSGHSVAVRGTMNISARGNLLLDPSYVNIVTGSGGTGAATGTHTGLGFGAGTGSVGTGFIDTKLNAGVNVEIDALKRIHNTTGVGINATGTGGLTLKIGDKGSIDLHGFNITIGGALATAVVGSHKVASSCATSHCAMTQGATEKFGIIKAASVNIQAGHSGQVTLHGASGSGTTAKKSVVATTGNIVINGQGVTTSAGSKGLQLSAAGASGNVDMSAKMNSYSHDVIITAGNAAKLNRIHTTGNILVTAKRIGYSGSGNTLELQAGGNLNVQGQFASNSTAGKLNVSLKLEAGSSKHIKVDQSITDAGFVSFNAGHLIYTPNTGTFTVNAQSGDVLDYAAIGSANAKAAYGVNFTAAGSGAVRVEKSIYTTKAISLTGSNVFIGGNNSAAMTLWADDGNATTTTDNITITATGASSNGFVVIHPAAAHASAGSTVDHSVTVHAGQNVVVAGKNVGLLMGSATAFISGGTASAATAKSNLVVSAGHNVTITAGSNVHIGATNPRPSASSYLASHGYGQRDIAVAVSDPQAHVTAKAVSVVSVTAGRNLSVTASNGNVNVEGGNEAVVSQTSSSGQTVTAKANGAVSLSAGNNLSLTAGHNLAVQAGNGYRNQHSAGSPSGFADHVGAGNSGAKAVGVTAADVSLTGANTVTLLGHNNVAVQAGSNAAGAVDGTCGASCNRNNAATVVANAAKASASLTATAGVAVSAGLGGLKISAASGSLAVSGGNYAGDALKASASGNGAAVNADVEAKTVLTTPGTVALLGKGVRVVGGGSALGVASSYYSAAPHHIHGQINGLGSKDVIGVTANAGVSVTGTKGITMTGANNNFAVYGGFSAAKQLNVSQNANFISNHGLSGSAAVNVDQSVSLNAASGAITLKNPTGHLFLAAGGGNARSAAVVASYGGVAALNTKSGLSITAGGAFLASAASAGSNKYVQFEAGQSYDAAYTGVTANHNGKAAIAADASATLTAASVTLTGGSAYIGAAGNPGHIASNARSAHVYGKTGGQAALTDNNNVTITTPGAISVTAHVGKLNVFGASKDNAYSASVSASRGGRAKLTANGAVNVSAGGAVTLKATAGNINITAGSKDAKGIYDFASNNARATTIGNTGVTITAGGDFTASAGGNLYIAAGKRAVSHATVDAYHGSAAATVTTTDGIALSGDHVTLMAFGADMSIVGGESAASYAYAQGTDHGVATVSATDTLTINAKSAFKAKLGGSAVGGKILVGSGYTAYHADASGSTNGKATIAADGSAKIAVTSGNLTITTGLRAAATSGTTHRVIGPDVYIDANYNDSGAVAHASHGSASVTGKANTVLSASGAVTIAAINGNLSIWTSTGNADRATAKAFGSGAKATITARDAVGIQAGGAVALTAGNYLGVYAGDSQMKLTKASANSHGVANVDVRSNVNIIAGGAFTAKAGGAMSIYGGSQNGKSDTAKAYNGASATLSDDASLSIKASSITLSAGKSLEVYGGYDQVGYLADLIASNAAVAGITAKSGVNLTASTGSFTATAGKDLYMYGGYDSNAYDATGTSHGIRAEHHGVATLTTDTSVTVNAAKAISLGASGSMFLNGESYSVAQSDYVFGSDFGKATVNANGSLNFNAVTGFKAKLLGTGSHHDLKIRGGSDVAYGATASAQHNGHATINADASVNISVTGSTGSIKINTGAQTHDYLSIGGYKFNGESASAKASHAGTAIIIANAGVALNTKGDIAIRAPGASNALSIYGGDEYNAYNASASASGQSATAKVKVFDAIDISGRNVTLSAGKYVGVYGGYEYNGAHSAANVGGAYADNQAKAVVSVDTSVNINATGAFTATAGALSIYANEYYGAKYASASASHGGVAAYAENGSVNITAGGAVSLTAKTGALYIYGGYESNAEYARANASNAGNAALTANQSVTITAGGAFTASAATKMSIYAGYYYAGYSDSAKAKDGAKAGLSESAGVSITGTSLNFTSKTGTLSVYGGYEGGYSASVYANNSATANLSVKDGVNLTATSGDVNLTAGNDLYVYGGYRIGSSAHMYAYYNGKANMAVDASVNISGDHVNLNAGGTYLSIYGGSYVGGSAYLYGSHGGVINLTAKSGVSIATKSGFTAHLSVAGTTAHAGYLNIFGGSYAAYNGTQEGYNHETINETADASVSIDAGTGDLKLKVTGSKLTGGSLNIYGGSEEAYSAYLSGTDGAVNTLTAKGGVSLAAGGMVAIGHNKGAVNVYGGSYAAESASAYAFNGAVTKVGADATVAVNAGGNIVIGAGGTMSITAHDYTAYSAYAEAKTGGFAKVGATNQVSLIAGGSFNATAVSSAYVWGGYYNAEYASDYAYTGGTAKIGANGTVAIQAGGAVNITGGTGLYIYANADNGWRNYASADSRGVATINANNSVIIAGGGAVKLSGGSKKLDIHGASYNAEVDSAYAYHGGTATLTATGAVAIQGTSVTMTAGTNMSIYGGYRNLYGDYSSSHRVNHAEASDGGSVNVTGKAGVSITATNGAVTAKAGGNLSIYGYDSNAAYFYASANGTGAKATVTGDTSINISGATVALSAVGNLDVWGGYKTGYSDSVEAFQKGTATINATSQLNITGTNAVTVKIKGTGASHHLDIYGSLGVGYGDHASGTGGGVAVENAAGGVNIAATAPGGSVTIGIGSHQTAAGINIYAYEETGESASAFAKTGGTALLNANNAVNISAPGAITFYGAHAGLNVYASGSAGYSASAKAVGPGAVATTKANQSVNLSGGSVNGSVGGFVAVYGGYRYTGDDATAIASSGGAAKVATNATANITVTGNIGLLGSGMSIYAAHTSVGYSGGATAKHDGATATFNEIASANLTAGGTISLRGTTGSVDIYGGEYVGSIGHNLASDHATAKYTALGQVNITAGGDVNIQSKHNLKIYDSVSAGWRSLTTAEGTGANATTLADNSVHVTAGGNVNLRDGLLSNLSIHGGNKAGSGAKVTAGSGDTAALTANSQVFVNAGGNLTVHAGAKLVLQGGSDAFAGVATHQAYVTANDGTATVNANANVSLTAGGSIGLNLNNGALSIMAGNNGGHYANVTADGGIAGATAKTNAGISVFAGTALNVNGATSFKESGGNFPASHQITLSSSASGVAKAKLNQTVVLSGATISFNLHPTKHNGSNAMSAGNLVELGSARNVFHAPIAAVNHTTITPSVNTLSVRTTAELVRTAAMHIQLLSSVQAPLATLQTDGIVVNLATVLTHPEVRAINSTDFTPGQGGSGQAGSSACLATLVLGAGGHCSIR